MGLRKTLAALFGPTPKLSDYEVLADAAESHDKDKAYHARLVEAHVAEARVRKVPAIGPAEYEALSPEQRRAAFAPCPPFPPLETPSGRAPLDVLPEGLTAQGTTITLDDAIKQWGAIEAAQTLAAEHRVIAHRVESEAERRTRLLAEWAAHREADPMAAGRVPGEPMPRSEGELIAQATTLLGGEQHSPDTWRLLFSMALSYRQMPRSPFYEEHDGNQLIRAMLRDARAMR